MSIVVEVSIMCIQLIRSLIILSPGSLIVVFTPSASKPSLVIFPLQPFAMISLLVIFSSLPFFRQFVSQLLVFPVHIVDFQTGSIEFSIIKNVIVKLATDFEQRILTFLSALVSDRSPRIPCHFAQESGWIEIADQYGGGPDFQEAFWPQLQTFHLANQ